VHLQLLLFFYKIGVRARYTDFSNCILMSDTTTVHRLICRNSLAPDHFCYTSNVILRNSGKKDGHTTWTYTDHARDSQNDAMWLADHVIHDDDVTFSRWRQAALPRRVIRVHLLRTWLCEYYRWTNERRHLANGCKPIGGAHQGLGGLSPRPPNFWKKIFWGDEIFYVHWKNVNITSKASIEAGKDSI
jgi:hypothetical protein